MVLQFFHRIVLELVKNLQKTLEVIDFLEAGSTTDKTVEEGKCVEISTGAAMPKGADAVVMVEYCEKMDSNVNILTTVTPTQDVAKKRF